MRQQFEQEKSADFEWMPAKAATKSRVTGADGAAASEAVIQVVVAVDERSDTLTVVFGPQLPSPASPPSSSSPSSPSSRAAVPAAACPVTDMTSDMDFDVQVYTDSCQGGRKYMEDTFCIAFQPEVDSSSLDHGTGLSLADRYAAACGTLPPKRRKYVYAGIFDGHGGKEAAIFARDHLLQNIVSQTDFWSQGDDDAVLRAIREGFMATHYAMLKELEKWPKTSAGLPSTSGTTASVCFIMNNKVYSGHVGDSRIILARKNPITNMWIPHSLTEDHKPGSEAERQRITKAGGEVMSKSGVDRVVWFRPTNGHKGPIRRSTAFDKIPFLAIARSLGDLWSYNPDLDTYVVSPDPDLNVQTLNPDEHKCLILASDGLWNMLLDYESVRLVQELREDIKPDLLKSLRNPKVKDSKNPSEVLVHYALQKWNSGHLRADNTSAVTLILHPNSPVPAVSPSFCVTDENVTRMPRPIVLPVMPEPAEFWIRAADPKVERIVPVVVQKADDFALLSPSMQSLCKFTESHAEVFSQTTNTNTLSSRESLSPSRRFTFSVPAVSLSTKDSSPTSMISDTNHIYINELPDESFEALSHALRLNNALSNPKVISGVTVISDFDEDSNRSDTSFDGKKNKSCSVTEALVDDVPGKAVSGKPVERKAEIVTTSVKVVSCKMLQELNGNTPAASAHVSQKDEIENSSDKNNAPQEPASPTESLSPSCESRGRKRKGSGSSSSKWLTSEPPSKKFLRSSRLSESRGMRFTIQRTTRNMIARMSKKLANARPLRSKKISFYNNRH